ncbi:unnamed protein product [Cylicocyclus nassatus]|uniref:CC domain-containing protein n=1 Tax=Cylicocyclus nassatus TaxID=53992 RepID=A0AA36DK00_CYLNA|nr:unnamed protein product [Cylicocyclus nassatus]
MITSRSIVVALAFSLPVSSLNCTQRRYKRQEQDLNIHLCQDQQPARGYYGGYGGGYGSMMWWWPMMMMWPLLFSRNYGGYGGYGYGTQTFAQPVAAQTIAAQAALTPTQQCVGPCVNGQCPAGYTCNANNQCCTTAAIGK